MNTLMIKSILAILLVILGYFIGNMKVQKMKKHEELLESIKLFNEEMMNAMQYHHQSLQEAMTGAIRNVIPPLQTFLLTLLERLQQNKARFFDVWQATLDEQIKTSSYFVTLQPEDKLLLNNMAHTLTLHDNDEQKRQMQMIIQDVKKLIDNATMHRKKDGALVRKLYLCAGIFLAIILF